MRRPLEFVTPELTFDAARLLIARKDRFWYYACASCVWEPDRSVRDIERVRTRREVRFRYNPDWALDAGPSRLSAEMLACVSRYVYGVVGNGGKHLTTVTRYRPVSAAFSCLPSRPSVWKLIGMAGSSCPHMKCVDLFYGVATPGAMNELRRRFGYRKHGQSYPRTEDTEVSALVQSVLFGISGEAEVSAFLRSAAPYAAALLKTMLADRFARLGPETDAARSGRELGILLRAASGGRLTPDEITPRVLAEFGCSLGLRTHALSDSDLVLPSQYAATAAALAVRTFAENSDACAAYEYATGLGYSTWLEAVTELYGRKGLVLERLKMLRPDKVRGGLSPGRALSSVRMTASEATELVGECSGQKDLPLLDWMAQRLLRDFFRAAKRQADTAEIQDAIRLTASRYHVIAAGAAKLAGGSRA